MSINKKEGRAALFLNERGRTYERDCAYFSPSGGTKRACELVGGLFDAKEYVNLGGRTRAQRNFSKDELLVLAVPVYAGQMPAVPGLLDGLKGRTLPVSSGHLRQPPL